MRQLSPILLLVVLAGPLCAQCALQDGGLQVTTAAGSFQFAPEGARFATSGPGLAATGHFVMRDGRAPKTDLPPVKLTALQAEQGRGAARATAEGLETAWSFAAAGPWADVTITLRNTGDQQRLLELGWQVQVPPGERRLWAGFNTYPLNREIIIDRLEGAFPIAAVYDGSQCLAFGVSPEDTLSYFRRTCRPEAQGPVCEHVNRIVLDPGGSAALHYVLANFDTRWGQYEPLQHFYARYPALFVPTPGVDPRASLNGGSYLAWTTSNDCELARRMQVGWEWAYAPFKRTGDIVGRPQFWDYTPVRPFSADRTVPREQYLKTRAARFADGARNCDVGMMFYIPSQIWAEERLAREVYPDSLITDKKVKTYFDTPWVTGHDNELRVFPMNTSFGKQSRTDMAEVARELEIAGFAFDTANGGARYYGPAVPTLPGRAWDEAGVYVDEAVAIADLMRYVHTLPERYGCKLAAVANPGVPSYLTAFACDSSMLESDPTSTESQTAQSIRAFLGHKTLVFWETYEYEDLLNGDLKPEQMLDALRGLGDHALLAALQVAALPTPRVAVGNRRLTSWLPLLADIARAGWQPIPAATTDPRLFVTRTGAGLGTYLCSGNMTGDTIDTRLELQSRYLGEGSFFLVRQDGRATTSDLRGALTSVPFALASREPAVWQAAGQLVPAADAAVTAERQRTADRERLLLTVEPKQSLRTRLRLPVPKDMRLQEATCDGRKLTFAVDGGVAEAAISARAGAKTAVEVTFVSGIFEATQQAVLGLPWVADNRPGFAVRAATKTAPEEEYAVQRLAGYFPYYLRNAMNVADPGVTPVLRGEAAAPGPFTVRVQVDAKQPQAERIALPQPQTLLVSGKTPADVKRAMYRLLALLDRQYPYGGKIIASNLFKATGVAGLEVK